MIFPALKNKKYGYVDLNLEAQKWLQGSTTGANPLLDPNICQEMVDTVHQKYAIDFSYGGWMEDRSTLWKGSYLEEKKLFVHLGVDINVPPGTDIAADFDAEIVKVDDDYPEDGGWGPRIIMRHSSEPVYMIYAHLDRTVAVKKGDRIKKGETFAKVGKAPYNGNWFPHLHVQAITLDYYLEIEKNDSWSKLDGYGLADAVRENASRFPDPLRFISFK